VQPQPSAPIIRRREMTCSRVLRAVIVSGIYPPDIGGPATHARDLAIALRRRGHAVTVLTLGCGPREAGVVRVPRSWPWPMRLMVVFLWLLVRRRRYDVVYATGLEVPAVWGCRVAGRPVVVKVVGDPAWERGRRLGVVSSDFEAYQRVPPRNARDTLHRFVRDRTLVAATAIVTPSNYLREVVRRWVRHEREVAVIQNGVERISNPSREHRPEGSIRLLSVGRLVSHKNVATVIRAVARVPGAVLHVVGEGPELTALRSTATKEHVTDRVSFLGVRTRTEVFAELAWCDVFVSASGYEGLPHTVLEALVAGVPVVSSDAGGTGEAVRHEVNGLIVDPPTVEGVASAVSRLQSDADLLDRLRIGAGFAGDEWSLDRTVDRVETLLASLVQRPRLVLLGKGAAGGSLARLDALAATSRTTIVSVGGETRLARTRGVGAISLPRSRLPVVNGVMFRSLGSAIAVSLAAGRQPGAVIAQSPYEAFGVLVLRRAFPSSVRPKVVTEVHGDWKTATREYGSPSRRHFRGLADRVAEWAVRRSDRVRVVSDHLEDQVRKAGFRGTLDRYPAFTPLDDLLDSGPVPPPRSGRVLYLGMLVTRCKGLDLLLDSWAEVVAIRPEARLTLVGDGPDRAELERDAERLGLQPSVEFFGPVAPDDVSKALDDCDLLVLASRSEGLGRVILEAQARGRAVVAPAVGGIPELVESNVTGLLAQPDDPADLARQILAALANPDSTAAMGRNARAQAESRDVTALWSAGLHRLESWLLDAS